MGFDQVAQLVASDEVSVASRRRRQRCPAHEGLREQQWILMDYGDVVIHVFLESIREFYEIERLYLDVPRNDREPAGRPGND